MSAVFSQTVRAKCSLRRRPETTELDSSGPAGPLALSVFLTAALCGCFLLSGTPALAQEAAAASADETTEQPAADAAQAEMASLSLADGQAAVERFLSDVTTYTARFSQELWGVDQRLLERYAGDVMISRPDRLRWAVTEPYAQLLVANGELLKNYDADIERLEIYQLDDYSPSNPMALLSGNVELTESYEIVQATGSENAIWVDLEPLHEDTDIALLRLGFVDNVLTRMQWLDVFDQTTTYEFSSIEVNQPIDPEAFELEVPESTEIVGGPG